LLGKDRPPFSDGTSGALFFREVEQLLGHPLYPEMTVVWEGTQAMPRIVTQSFDVGAGEKQSHFSRYWPEPQHQ
jgi:S-DNA-T family DNA segregation ATPase FtsK/SpoIIIE